MRKVQQQEILELVKTLHEAHVEIKENIKKGQNHIAQSILADCQECAISIGNVIEAFEGEGFVTISFLEEYCQVLFQSHESLNDTNVNENRIYKNLEKQLIRIENSIKTDIPIRKEIAFFPYKASMWDSLESIYLAAKEDPDVDAYCVPIPYFDLNPDRSFGKMHYEGLEYPKNIEVIDWQTYNFEERKPDVIYIHNPYDNWNLVTSVHPRFYSDRLKVATEELVYVPYFVLGEIEPADQQAIDGMKHFCFLPGVINADKVILQSENMAKIYVNEYLKAANANGLIGKHIDREALNKKFLGIGSPKLEKVKKTKREDLEIPDEWLRIIEKPDGSWKKIIFYNTGIAALLEHNEKMLEKMKWVFNIFKENQDEVALLWRPHPLIKNTVSAMRPWLWEEYVNTLIGEMFYHPKNKAGKGAQRLFAGNYGLIYPDFIGKDSGYRIIADAKYKPLDNIRNKDYHQILAYMFRFDAKKGLFLYPEAGKADDLRFVLNQGTSYEKNVVPREDIFVMKHGLQIPNEAKDYDDFVEQMNDSEQAFCEGLCN